MTGELTPQQQRLFESACDWFAKGQEALEAGDPRAFTVARLAHKMISAAYRATLPNADDKLTGF